MDLTGENSCYCSFVSLITLWKFRELAVLYFSIINTLTDFFSLPTFKIIELWSEPRRTVAFLDSRDDDKPKHQRALIKDCFSFTDYVNPFIPVFLKWTLLSFNLDISSDANRGFSLK